MLLLLPDSVLIHWLVNLSFSFSLTRKFSKSTWVAGWIGWVVFMVTAQSAIAGTLQMHSPHYLAIIITVIRVCLSLEAFNLLRSWFYGSLFTWLIVLFSLPKRPHLMPIQWRFHADQSVLPSFSFCRTCVWCGTLLSSHYPYQKTVKIAGKVVVLQLYWWLSRQIASSGSKRKARQPISGLEIVHY